jgi:hypothetical protein
MKLTGENRSTRGKTCLSATNPIWTDPGLNPELRGGRPVANRLSHGTAYVFRLSRWQNYMDCSRAYSRVNWLKTSDVSETHSVCISRESDHFLWGCRRNVSLKRRRFLINWHGYLPQKSWYSSRTCYTWRPNSTFSTEYYYYVSWKTLPFQKDIFCAFSYH